MSPPSAPGPSSKMAGKTTRAERAAKRKPKGNGHWRLSMETSWGPLLDAVGEIGFQQTKWEPAFEDLATKLERGARDSFRSARGPDGHKWRPLTPEYRERKQGRGALVMSGKLKAETKRSNAVKLLTGTRMVYEVDRPYASTHQFGKFPAKRKTHGGFPGARVRNYILWGDELKEEFAKSLNDYGEQVAEKAIREAELRGR